MPILVKNLLAQSAMAGWSNGNFCREMAEAGAGMVTLGGYSVDDATYQAGLAVSLRRREFVMTPDGVVDHIVNEASEIRPTGALVCVNLRFLDLDVLSEVCAGFGDAVDILELNAHCRQPEFTHIGSGEALLERPKKLLRAVDISSKHCTTLVKVRAMNLRHALLPGIKKSGALGLHLDLMKPGKPSPDMDLLEHIRKSTDMVIVGNNSVRDEGSFVRMLMHGADMVSMARVLLDGTKVIRRILDSDICWSSMREASKRTLAGFKLREEQDGMTEKDLN